MNEKRKILVIDDENLIRLIVRRTLEQHGYDVVLAANGSEGLMIANTSSPDAILLDVNLPDLDGFQVCTELRSTRTTSRIPVIMMTAADEPEDRAHGFNNGADDYITKPFECDELLARIKAQLRK
ncbi:MAG: response regulator transcription factor [Chloroflexi bacterium]|nr:response regulator transcription factor [Chloroflexota bacterium]